MEVYQYNWVDQVKILLNYDIFFNLTVKEINIKTLEDIIKQEDETNWIFKVFNKVDFGKFIHMHIIMLNHEYLLYFFRIIFYSYTICIFFFNICMRNFYKTFEVIVQYEHTSAIYQS